MYLKAPHIAGLFYFGAGMKSTANEPSPGPFLGLRPVGLALRAAPPSPGGRGLSMYGFDFLLEVVHQNVLAEIHGCREVRFAAADLGDLLDEVDEVVVAGKHEGIDEDSRFAARGHFFEQIGRASCRERV